MDIGLNSLVSIARFHQLSAEAEQLQHGFSQLGKIFILFVQPKRWRKKRNPQFIQISLKWSKDESIK